MDILFSVLKGFFAFAIIISIVVFVHEFGHYIFAKMFGVKVESFSIGFGKELFGWNDKSGTRWKLSILPFGGYVKMFGDEDPSSSQKDKEKLQKLSEKEKSQTLYYQNVWKRFMIVFAGPFFNLLFAILILTALYKVNGITYFDPLITDITKNSPAEKAGIKEGDLIVEINGREIRTFSDVRNEIALSTNKVLNIGIIRDDKFFITKVNSEVQETEDPLGNKVKSQMIGISTSAIKYREVNLLTAFLQASASIYKTCITTLKALGQMILGRMSPRELGGPLKIAKYSSQSFSKGIETTVWLITMISANLGLMNLLPIPVLDGGHLFFYLIEGIRKKPIPEEVQNKLFRLGFAFLIMLMVFATINDIIAIF